MKIKLTQWLEKLGREHKDSGTFWDFKDFQTNLIQELPALKNQPQELWKQAYDFYKFCVCNQVTIEIQSLGTK